ncbi:DUF3223 domain-containing protein [Ottowia beijingensis]|uniref:DUF3223 domain-containing protein n=1 Tax=Ottowia beijingensis TaxID=1207057 RepID=UPI003631B35F
MPAAIPVVLDHKTFTSQNKARLHFSEMLHRYKVGETVSDVDRQELQSLLKHHPLHDATAAIDHIAVAKSGFGRECFMAVRPDCTTQRLSYVGCIRHSAQPEIEEEPHQPAPQQAAQGKELSPTPQRKAGKNKPRGKQ